MTSEVFANSPTPGVVAPIATLAGNGGSVSSSATTIHIAAALPSVLQSGGQFHALLDQELVIIPTQSGTSVAGITRGAEGSTPASHLDGALIYPLLTAGALENALAGIAAGADPVGSAAAVKGLPIGLTGATAAGRYVGATASGAPVTGSFVLGDWCTDQTGRRWTCTASGSPGTWSQEPGTGGGGSGLPSSPLTYGAVVWNGTAWESDLAGAVDICAEFGVSTSNVDNSTAINTALSTLGPLGLIAFISKPGVYAIKNPIVIGNGTTSTFSTWSATLMGAGMPGNANVTGNGTGTVQTMIQWAGSSGGAAMVQVQGPLTGWGLKNLAIDGGSTSLPSFGLSVTSGVRGRIDNVAISNTQSGIQLTTVTARSGALAAVVCDTIMNVFQNVSINFIGKTGQKSFGIILQSGLTTAGNSCYNEFDCLWITPPNSSFGGATINYNIYFQGCDSNLIRNWTSDPSTGTDTHWATFWDYSQINIWPAGNVIDKVDFASLASSSTGSPSTAGTIGANSIINISAVNGQPGNPHLPNVRWGNNTYNGSVALSAGTATVTACQTVQAGSFIRLSVVPAGTPGNVVVSSRSTGTFTITSYQPGTTTTQTTDTSTIFWEVLNDSKF